MIRRSGLFLITVLVTAACVSTPTPSPSAATAAPSSSPTPTTPSGSPSPTESEAPGQVAPLVTANGWPVTLPTGLRSSDPSLIGNSTFLVVGDPATERSQIVRLDAGGFMSPGWPIEAAPGAAFGQPVGSFDYSSGAATTAIIYVEECGEAGAGCVIHRLDDRGRTTQSPGWPFRVPPEFACASPACSDSLHVAPNLTLYLAHGRDVGGMQLLAIDPVGQVRPGWPASSGVEGGWWSDPLFDGDSAFMRWDPDGGPGTPSIAAFGPDGRLKAGWPAPVPGLVGYQLGSGGRVTAWSWEDVPEGDLCANPRRTVFTMIGSDGRTLAGWPRGSIGLASKPVTWGDSVRYVSATGKVYDHGLSGEVTSGWPVVVPGALGDGCGPATAYVTPNGATFVLGDEVHSLSNRGRPRGGWPYDPPGELVLPPMGGDTDGFPGHVPPAFLGNTAICLVIHVDDLGGALLEVICLDSAGQVMVGWPYRLPIDPATATVDWFMVSDHGLLYIRSGAMLLALSLQGQIAH